MNIVRFVICIVIITVALTSCMDKEEVEVLNVIQATNSQVLGDEITGYKLKIEGPHDTVIWFSNRPIRESGNVSMQTFLKAWDEGKGGYKSDPPNAVLIISNAKPVVVELDLLTWTENNVTFSLKPIEGQQVKLTASRGPVSLFIDGFDVVNPQIVD